MEQKQKIYTLAESPGYPQILDAYQIQFPCPFCGHNFDQTLGWLKSNSEVACPSCRERIVFAASRFQN